MKFSRWKPSNVLLVRGPKVQCLGMFFSFVASLLMFFWLSKQRGNLTHSCRHAFMTTFCWPITLSGSLRHFSRVECQANGSGYEAAAAAAQVEGWRVQWGLRGRANSLRTKCAGTSDLWKSSPGRKLPDSKQKLQGWKESWRKHTVSAGPIPHTFPSDWEAHKINRAALLTLQNHKRRLRSLPG